MYLKQKITLFLRMILYISTNNTHKQKKVDIMEYKQCLHPECKKEYPLTRKNRKFCSDLCRSRYDALLYYQKHKDEVEFKAKNHLKFEEWRQKNKPHFNELLRERNKVLNRQRSIERLSKGLCIKCGKVITNFSFDKKIHKFCIACRLLSIKNSEKSRLNNRVIKNETKKD